WVTAPAYPTSTRTKAPWRKAVNCSGPTAHRATRPPAPAARSATGGPRRRWTSRRRCRSHRRSAPVRARCRYSVRECSPTSRWQASPATSSTSGIPTIGAGCPSAGRARCRRGPWRGSSGSVPSWPRWRGSARARRSGGWTMAEGPGERRAERWAAVSFALATVAAVALAVVFWRGGQPQAEGVLLAVVTGGLGVGIVLWARLATPQDHVTEERHLLGSTGEGMEA